ncbi:MAG: ABC transporter ATP-binding protein [Ardenticatenaceae bacterium]|nr:ABC transporter ATP-binding protein [Ardenticatenaceae bacterium]HBY94135.1 spermidine/putrescine ABC transporter ATP-binding protein [Chloroflexota bacterium]
MTASHAVELAGVTKKFKAPGSHEITAVDNVTLRINDGEFFSLLGPSGCGKTTSLRMIAGFEIPDRGEILVLGQPMGDTPPYLRPVNTVFQNYALFPHMTVAENVGFGLRMEGVSRGEIDRRMAEALEMVQLGGMGARKPKQLSGGQQQRVALARALVKRPAVLLLDEPLGALDLKLRKAMQLELKHMQQNVGITFLYVTHDQEEALTMSDRIAVMNYGRVLQVGTPMEIYEQPTGRFVADFIGESNFIQGVVRALDRGVAQVAVDEQLLIPVPLNGTALRPGASVTLMVRPEKGTLAPGEGQAPNSWPGRIEERVYIGTDMRYVVRLTGTQSVVVRVQNLDRATLTRFQPGDAVHVHWAPPDIRLLVEE